MKTTQWLALALVSAATWNTPSFAMVDKSAEQACFDYSITEFEQNARILGIFNNSTIDEKSVVIDRYEGTVGNQPVSTVVEARLLNGKRKPNGRFLCLLGDGGEPLFLYYFAR